MYNIKAKHIIIAVVVILAFVGIAMFGMPVYRVWSQEMKGKAELAEAEQNRRIKIVEANRKNADLKAETDEPTNNTKAEERPSKSTKNGSQSKAKATKGKKKE